MTPSKYLPDGIEPPDLDELDHFWRAAASACEELAADADYRVRWIGLDEETTLQIFALIAAGDKTGTFTLPWLVARTGQPESQVGDDIVLVDVHGKPHQVVRLTAVSTVAFADIDERHTAIDGPPVRPLAIWKPLHEQYWNGLLAPHGLAVSDDMPVWIEPFRLMYSRGHAPGSP